MLTNFSMFHCVFENGWCLEFFELSESKNEELFIFHVPCASLLLFLNILQVSVKIVYIYPGTRLCCQHYTNQCTVKFTEDSYLVKSIS